MRILSFVVALILNAHSKAQKPHVIKTDSEKDLIPEGIAVDASTGIIYISSIAKQKIIAVDSNGVVSDFVKTGDNGYLEGLGMKVDKKKIFCGHCPIKKKVNCIQANFWPSTCELVNW